MQEESHKTDPTSKGLRLTAILVSLLGGLVILGIKLYAAHISDSTALRSDALEGSVNVLAAAFGLGSVLFAEKPADDDHPYGHGKIEYFAQAFEGGLISLAGFLIVIDTISRVLHPAPLGELGLGLKLSIFAGFLNGLIGLGIYLVGKKHQSQVLVADGIHLFTDLITTVILGLGLFLVLKTGYTWLDPVLALCVALFLFKTGFMLVRDSSKALLDAENPKLTERIVSYLNEIPRSKIITVHDMKAQEFGRDKHVDIHVVVPEFLSIKEAHDVSDQFSMKLAQKLGHGSEVHTHLDPCERDYCDLCPMEKCLIRRNPFTVQTEFTRKSVTEPGKH